MEQASVQPFPISFMRPFPREEIQGLCWDATGAKRGKTCNRRRAQEACKRCLAREYVQLVHWIGLGHFPDWLKKWHVCFDWPRQSDQSRDYLQQSTEKRCNIRFVFTCASVTRFATRRFHLRCHLVDVKRSPFYLLFKLLAFNDLGLVFMLGNVHRKGAKTDRFKKPYLTKITVAL